MDSGYVFTRPDGAPFHPGYFTQRLRLLINRADLPPVRLQNLRHGAASLAHAAGAGADLKTIQDLLGHSNVSLTADVYTEVLPDKQRQAAEDTAQLLLDAGHTIRAPLAIIKRTMVLPRRPRREPAAPTTIATPPRSQRHRTHKSRSRYETLRRRR
ncbi:tyrosine-type recombinase/integrase [Actinoplanes sp. NPDC049265]|uniref:tyrosine-type recombinase/integrase n=1 Tax=Actinoplanes sp. NPDC049265 TaxID=3363902 RepID=UPI00371DFD2E